jgi:hypothetical protein
LTYYASAAAAAPCASLQAALATRLTAAAAAVTNATTAAALRQRLQIPILITHHAAYNCDHASRLQLLYLLVAALRTAQHFVQLLVLCPCACHLLFCF